MVIIRLMDYAKVYDLLKNQHKDAHCELNFGSVFQLIVAVVLSAQCTDKRVNQVTEDLFRTASEPEDFVRMPQEELEKRIFSCGFYHNKAKSIKSLSQSIIDLGYIPDTVEGLMKLQGVGRKTANVVYSVAYGGNAIAVDTHVFRVSNRIGIADGRTPYEVESQLMEHFPEENWSTLHHLLIFHGRYVCHSQKPDCENCSLKNICKEYKK